MLKEPSQLAIDECLVRVVMQTLVPQKLEAAADPAPTVGEILELDGDVVGHVPGLHEPDLNKMRLEFGNPIGQLRHLEKFIFVLQIAGADPKRVRNQSAKTAESDR